MTNFSWMGRKPGNDASEAVVRSRLSGLSSRTCGADLGLTKPCGGGAPPASRWLQVPGCGKLDRDLKLKTSNSYSLSLFCCGPLLPLPPCPAFLVNLAAAADGQGVVGNVLGNTGSGADISALADLHWRYQGGVAADEGTVADHRGIFAKAVVITSDGAGAYIHPFAHLRIAQVAQVLRLGALAQLQLFAFHKIAHVRAFGNVAAGTQMGIWTEHRLCRDAGVIHHTAVADEHTLAQFAIDDHAVGANAAFGADARGAQQVNKRLDNRIRTYRDVRINHAGLWLVDGDPVVHQLLAFLHPQFRIHFGQFLARVAAQNLVRVVGLHRDH